MSTAQPVAVPKGLGALIGTLLVLTMLASLFIAFGVPLLLGLLIFPALGLTGTLLAFGWVALYVAWWALLILIRR